MSNKHLMIVELSPEHAIGLQNSPLARDALLIQGIKKAIVKLHSTEVDVTSARTVAPARPTPPWTPVAS